MNPDPEQHLALRHAHYLILISLAEGELHGYALKKVIGLRTDGRVQLGAGSLYRSLGQLVDRGLIEKSGHKPDGILEDERRTYFRLTPKGRDAAAAETERLARLVADARALGIGS